jgi:peroxiredoxin Q/BCP
MNIGDVVPDFSLPASGGTTFRLSEARGKRVVLFFYPKDMTPGCTKEACDFRDRYDALVAKDIVVVGISPDDVRSHEKFVAKHALPFPLLADTQASVAGMFGVWVEKSMYGKKYMGIERSTWIIDENGVLKHAWRNVKVPGHVGNVWECVIN